MAEADPGFARPAPKGRATPFLDLDHDRLLRNLRRMQARADAAGAALRPHVKTHKSLDIARLQLETGARGVTASKPSEARVFVEGGIGSVTLAYPVVRPEALDDLLGAARSRGADVRFIAGDRTHVSALAAAGARHGLVLPVFLKVDVGLGRIGVQPGSDMADALARRLHEGPWTSFAGLIAHAGQAYSAKDADGLAAIARREAEILVGLGGRLAASGVPVPVISVGATPTCLGAPIPPEINEIRPGNYALLDRTALRLGICTADDLALSVVATVVGRAERHAIIDAGSKALSSDGGPHGTAIAGFGLVTAADALHGQEWRVEKLSEEHGFVACGDRDLQVGARVRVFPNHACATVACFEVYGPADADPDAPNWRVDGRSCLV